MNAQDSESAAIRLGDLDKLLERGYMIGSQIGKGSFATVHQAEYHAPNTEIYQQLACRVFDQQRAPAEFLENFFYKEIEILSRIRNQHIVQLHSIMAVGPRVFIFMRYEENGDLLQYLKKSGALEEHLARRWFYQMMSGLYYLHENNVAHRDLKCENILISGSNNVKIADFGFATFCLNNDGTRLLSTTFCGSTAYAAPEILSGTPHDPKPADVWSLGVVLFVMLSSSMPFDDSQPVPVLVREQVTQQWKTRLEELGVVMSEGAMSVLAGALKPDTIGRLTVDKVLSHDWLKKSAARRNELTTVAIMEPVPPRGTVLTMHCP